MMYHGGREPMYPVDMLQVWRASCSLMTLPLAISMPDLARRLATADS